MRVTPESSLEVRQATFYEFEPQETPIEILAAFYKGPDDDNPHIDTIVVNAGKGYLEFRPLLAFITDQTVELAQPDEAPFQINNLYYGHSLRSANNVLSEPVDRLVYSRLREGSTWRISSPDKDLNIHYMSGAIHTFTQLVAKAIKKEL